MTKDQREFLNKIRGTAKEREDSVRILAKNSKLKNNITSFIVKNSGDDDDAMMIFHDSIVAFVRKVFADQQFVLTSSIDAYIFGIAKILWLTKLRKNKSNPLHQFEEFDYSNEMSINLEGNFDSAEKIAMLKKIMGHLRSNCREVLLYWAAGYSMIEIAKLCGYKSEGMARKKKCECFKELISWLEENPRYLKELKN